MLTCHGCCESFTHFGSSKCRVPVTLSTISRQLEGTLHGIDTTPLSFSPSFISRCLFFSSNNCSFDVEHTPVSTSAQRESLSVESKHVNTLHTSHNCIVIQHRPFISSCRTVHFTFEISVGGEGLLE
jgi:hypothetical protein